MVSIRCCISALLHSLRGRPHNRQKLPFFYCQKHHPPGAAGVSDAIDPARSIPFPFSVPKWNRKTEAFYVFSVDVP